jgi:ribosomal protein S18 acetylase RimI-like enzyme
VEAGPRIRRARLADIAALEALIAASVRALSAGDYTPRQVEGALRGAFGVDTQLIRDGSYFVIEAGARFAGCGGWSRRRTLFGSDARGGRDATELDPATDAAKIRAFFIHPDFARRGLGSRLLEHCEREAAAHGFRRLEMMATLPGIRLYRARGYAGDSYVDWPLDDGTSIRFLPMSKTAPPFPQRIEPARSEDAPAILGLQKRAYESEARLYQDWSIPALHQTVESLRAEIANSVVLKAVDAAGGAGRIVGSVRGREADGTCHVGRLCVEPEMQGSGIGTRLLRAIEAAFPAARRFELFTGGRSEGNIHLYERLGYSRLHEQVSSPAVTLVFMEKKR